MGTPWLVRSRNCERTALPCPTQTGTLDTLALAEMLLTHGADVNARMTAKPPTKGTYDYNYMSLVGPYFRAPDETAALLRKVMGPSAPPRPTSQGAR